SAPESWLGLELRHLIALKAIAEQGTFSRAASSLGYTQSAVSQQIATLERIVGQRLIDRPGGPRPVSLTEAGELLLRHADALVVQADSPLASRDRTPALRELLDQPLISNRTCRTTQRVEERLRHTGRDPHIAFRSDDNGTVQGLVAAGVGIAIVPRLTVDETD